MKLSWTPLALAGIAAAASSLLAPPATAQQKSAADGKVLYAKKEIKVTLGGCGG